MNWMYGYPALEYISIEPILNLYEENEQWSLVNTTHGTYVADADEGGHHRVPGVYLSIRLSRHPIYYIMNVLGPCLLISLLSTLVFLLPAESGEKISLGITVSLSYTVLLLMVSEITPQSGKTLPLLSR